MKATSIIALIASALLAGGCSRGQSAPEPPAGAYTFAVDVPGASPSKALGEDQEAWLQSIDLLLFEKDGTDEKLASRHKIDAAAIDNSGTIRTFKTFLTADATKQYRIVLLANLRAETDAAETAGKLTAGTLKQTALDAVTFDYAAVWNTDPLSPRYLPMWGESEGHYTIKEGTVFTTIQLLRAVARFDVTVDATLQTDFKIQEIRIYNYMPAGQAAPAAGRYSHVTRKVTLPSLTPDASVRGPLIFTPAAENQSVREIYTAEYDNLNAGDKTTALVIGARWQGAAQPTWYLVEMTDPETGQPFDILRNKVYAVHITDVEGPGYTDPGSALEGGGVLGAEVIPWEAGDYTEQSAAGDYYLTVSQTRFHFNCDGRTGASKVNTYDDHKILIRTNDPAGWKISKVTDQEGNILSESETWVTIETGYYKVDDLSVSPENGYGDAPRTRTETYDPDMSCFSFMPNTTGATRHARIYLSAGAWEYVLHLSQEAYTGECGQNNVPLMQTIGQNTYRTHLYTDTQQRYVRCWMVDNLREVVSAEYDNQEYVIKEFDDKAEGERGYYYSTAKVRSEGYDPCPEGWRLPDLFDCWHLAASFVPTPDLKDIWNSHTVRAAALPGNYEQAHLWWFDPNNMAGTMLPSSGLPVGKGWDSSTEILFSHSNPNVPMWFRMPGFSSSDYSFSAVITTLNNPRYISARCVKETN